MNKSNFRFATIAVSSLLFFATALNTSADVTGIEISKREILQSADSTLEYEAIYGTLTVALDPEAAGNQKIADIHLAPTDAGGQVEFSTDFKLLTPRTGKVSHTLLYHVNNRGGSRLPPEISLTHPLATQGYSYLVTGWINELTPGSGRIRLHAPIVGSKENPITGRVRYEIIAGEAENDVNIAGDNHLSYAPTQAGMRDATLTRRTNQSDPRISIPRSDFSLTVSEAPESNQPLIAMNVKDGLQPGVIYELIYEAKDPVLGGAGMAAIRDMMSLLRYGSQDASVGAEVAALNLPDFDHTVTWGNSQSGRLLRLFLYQGFNEDLEGRQVFDGIMPVIAGAGYGMFNNRFAMPTRTNGQHENQFFPNDYFPFTYGDSTDPYSGRTDGVLRQSRLSNTEPKVMHIQTANEYWIRGGSLPHTDPLGTVDAEIPDNVRFYAIGGSQHGSGNGQPRPASAGQLPSNPNMWSPIADSLLQALVEWVEGGSLPPPSKYPRIADGTLVHSHLNGGSINANAWHPLPGYDHPKEMYKVAFADYGSHFLNDGIIDKLPLSADQYYEPMVPAIGANNNDLPDSTVLPPLTSVPLATFVPWNLRSIASGAPTELARLSGGYIPFSKTTAEAVASNDRRPPINELYKNFEDYLMQYEAATDRLIQQGYLLPQFKESYMEIARRNLSAFN